MLFFGLLSAIVVVAPPFASGAELFGLLVSGATVAVTIAYVLPWVFFELETEPHPVATTE